MASRSELRGSSQHLVRGVTKSSWCDEDQLHIWRAFIPSEV